GDLARAQKQFELAREILAEPIGQGQGEQQRQTALALADTNLGLLHLMGGRPREAAKASQRGLESLLELRQSYPEDHQLLSLAARCQASMARAQHQLGQSSEALESATLARALATKLEKDRPDSIQARAILAQATWTLAQIQTDNGQ